MLVRFVQMKDMGKYLNAMLAKGLGCSTILCFLYILRVFLFIPLERSAVTG